MPPPVQIVVQLEMPRDKRERVSMVPKKLTRNRVVGRARTVDCIRSRTFEIRYTIR